MNRISGADAAQQRFMLAPDGMAARVVLSVLATAGFFYVNIMPALVQGLVDALHFSQAEAGRIQSANMYAGALGGLLAVVLLVFTRVRWRPAAYLLLAALIAIDALSMQLTTPGALRAVRIAHGIAGGALIGISYAVMARTHEPDRTFGVLLFVQFGLGGLGVKILPGLVPVYGTAILFGTLISLSLLALVLLPLLAPYPAPPPPPRAEGRARAGSPAPLVLTLGAMFLFQAGNMALFPYAIGLGEAAGLGREFVTWALALGAWVGLAGAGLVVWLSTRYGRLRPLAAAILVTVLGNAMLLGANVPEVFLLANVSVGFTWAFVMPYLFGMCAAFDPQGRLAALGGLASKLGLASGPMAASFLIDGDRYERVIVLSVVTLLCCGALVIAPAAQLDRKA